MDLDYVNVSFLCHYQKGAYLMIERKVTLNTHCGDYPDK